MKVRIIIRMFILILTFLCTFLFVPSEIYVVNAEESLPSRYSMRDEYIVFAQHQDGLGYCWNFAATTAASTTIMKATGEYYDFSELWTGVALGNVGNQQSPFGRGGSLSYQYDAMKESGLMLETDLPYQHSYTVSDENVADYYNFFEKYSNDDLARSLIYDDTTRFTTKEIDKIKKHIYENGSVYLTFIFRQGFVESNGAYYLPPNQTNTNSSHAVSVIGWDDDFEREVYINDSTTPTTYKGAWMILNSYTEKNGKDGISYVFYDDANIGSISGYRYEIDTNRDLYFYDEIESGYAYPTNVKGKYYGDFKTEEVLTKQKNIFYDDVDLKYSYKISSGASIKSIDIYLGENNVTNNFDIRIDTSLNKFYIAKEDAVYGQYKVIVTYGNDEKSDTYLNNFFVTRGLIGEEIEFDYENNDIAFNTGLDLEYYSFINANKDYVIYTDKLSGEVSFLPTNKSIYSEKNMSIPKISYNIENNVNTKTSYTIKANSGYELEYNFNFEYYEDTSLQPVNVYYDLGGGVNNSKNYSKELAGPNQGLALYAPTRLGYTFAGWYLDYGNGTKKISETDGIYYVSWDDICHLGENPSVHAKSYYKNYYNNSNTVFVYARWEEETYHNIDITITGEGKSQITEDISICSNDSVRYLFKPEKYWCLSKISINGIDITGDEFLEISKCGLLIKNPSQDISISATFEKGVYLSMEFKDNIKDAYIVGTKDEISEKFRNGAVIPFDYFSDYRDQLFPSIKESTIPDIKDEGISKELGFNGFIPVLPFETSFSLIVEVADDSDGFTYVLEDATSYLTIEKGKFEKKYAIDKDDKFIEIKIGSALKTKIEPVNIVYTVGSYVEDHYISSDINATTGDKFSATFDAGQVIYLFIKKPINTVAYAYTVPNNFVSLGNQWYRTAICVNASHPDLGNVVINRSTQKYKVTWKNWDGSVIYSEDYRYGAKPVFNNKNAIITEYPTREEDELYTYVFTGWDKEITTVNSDVTYQAEFEAILKKFIVTVGETLNGTITPNGANEITPLDKHTYVFTPLEGYKVKDVVVNGKSVGAVDFYTFENILCDQSLFVEFEKIKYEINITSGENGNATSSTIVEYGENLRVDFNPKFGYRVKDVMIDGVSIGNVENYTFVFVAKNYQVEVVFELNTPIIISVSVTGSLLVVIIAISIFAIIEIRKNKNLSRWFEKLRKISRKNQ